MLSVDSPTHPIHESKASVQKVFISNPTSGKLCVRWYLRYPLSYRNLWEMMLERGLRVDQTTVYRWVLSLCSRTWQALPTLPGTNEWFVARGWDIYRGSGKVEINAIVQLIHLASLWILCWVPKEMRTRQNASSVKQWMLLITPSREW